MIQQFFDQAAAAGNDIGISNNGSINNHSSILSNMNSSVMDDASMTFGKMSSSNPNSDIISQPPSLHQGKWTPEEEEYVSCLISEFRAGQLPLAEGTSLRIFLSKMLNCNPMRISKKFVNSNYNGKQLYVRKPNTMPPEEVLKRRAKLQELERKFLKRVSPLSNLDGPGGAAGAADMGGAQGAMGSMSLSAAAGAARGSNESLAFENILSDLQMSQNGEAKLGGLSSRGRVNRSAAAAGRALLEGFNSGAPQRPSAAAKTLENLSSLEIMAELQRRASGESTTSMLKNSISVASCSSLGDLADLQRQASVDNMSALKRSLSRSTGGSNNNVLDQSLELALQSLVNKNNAQSAMNMSNSSGMSLSNGGSAMSLSGAGNSGGGLSFSKQSGTSLSNIASFLSAAEASKNEGGEKNWSFGGAAASKPSSNNMSDLMMQLAKNPSFSQNGSELNLSRMRNSNMSFKDLLLSMQGGGGGGARKGSQNETFNRHQPPENSLASAASLADLFNADNGHAGLGAGNMQNGTFGEKAGIGGRSGGRNLSGSLADYLAKQRLAAQANEGAHGSAGALLDMIQRNKAMESQEQSLRENAAGSLSMDQIYQLLAKQGGANGNQKRQFTDNDFGADGGGDRPWKKYR